MGNLTKTFISLFNPRKADEYLHNVVCAPKKNRSGSTPYANKRNMKRKKKPKRKKKREI